jgi:hypothetical protein
MIACDCTFLAFISGLFNCVNIDVFFAHRLGEGSINYIALKCCRRRHAQYVQDGIPELGSLESRVSQAYSSM